MWSRMAGPAGNWKCRPSTAPGGGFNTASRTIVKIDGRTGREVGSDAQKLKIGDVHWRRHLIDRSERGDWVEVRFSGDEQPGVDVV